MFLHFNSDKIPRTTTREQWYTIYRYKRQMERVCKKILDDNIEAVRRSASNLATYGTAVYTIELLDHLINPPMLVMTPIDINDFDLRPGGISYLR